MGLTWNLVVFGVLAAWGVGTAGAQAALSLKGRGGPSGPWSYGLAVLMLVAGSVCALLGMQHPERLLNVLGNPAAAITQQVYAILLVVATIAVWFVVWRRAGGEAPAWTHALVLIASVLAAVALGRRYLMPSLPLLDTWLWVAESVGFALCAGTATVAGLRVFVRVGDGVGTDGQSDLARSAAVVGAACSVVATAGYLLAVQAVCSAALSTGIKFDPTHPAAGASNGLLSSSDLGLAWGVGLVLGTVVPLALACVARWCKVGRAGAALCGFASALCAAVGAFVLRGVVFGLM